MSSIRLFVLGALSRHGPMHGHQIRHVAEEERSDRWTDFSVGALYGALKRMAGEGVIAVHATERNGNLPPRTVYTVTSKGEEELESHRHAILRDTRLRSDPVDLALQYSHDTPAEELLRVVDERHRKLSTRLDSWRELCDYAAPHLTGLESVLIRHTLFRLQAEIAWHDELLAHLNSAAEGGDGGLE